jgi:hypothetical protein
VSGADETSDQYWPVVLEFTEHRIVLVPANTPAEAVAAVKADDLGDLWEDAEPAEVQYGVEVSDSWTARSVIASMEQREIGPCEACPECEAVATCLADWALQYASHRRGCSGVRHRVAIEAFWGPRADGEGRGIVGWYLSCSCDEPGFERYYKREERSDRALIEAHGRRIVPGSVDAARAEPAAIAQAHVAGRPHGKNVPLGITDDLHHPDPRRRDLTPAGAA